MAGVRKQQPECKRQHCIQKNNPEPRIIEKEVILMGKRGECCKTSAKTGYQQSPELWGNIHTAVNQTEKKADKQAACKIYHKCCPRENAARIVVDNLAQQKSAASANSTAQHYP